MQYSAHCLLLYHTVASIPFRGWSQTLTFIQGGVPLLRLVSQLCVDKQMQPDVRMVEDGSFYLDLSL